MSSGSKTQNELWQSLLALSIIVRNRLDFRRSLSSQTAAGNRAYLRNSSTSPKLRVILMTNTFPIAWVW